MDRNDPPHDPSDPFAALEEWARQTERKVRRETRWHRLLRRGPEKRPRNRPRGSSLHSVARIVVAVVGLAVVATAIPQVRHWLPLGSPAVAGSFPAQPAATGSTATASGDPSAAAALGDPFAGTPAEAYPVGAAGIVLPKALALPGYPAKQVGYALDRVRTALIDGHLDEAMLVGHRPAALLALLTPRERPAIAGWFATRKFGNLGIWLDPAVKLDPDHGPRVNGRVTYSLVSVSGRPTLQVTTNIVWVYAFQGAFRGAKHPLAVAHDRVQWQFSWSKGLPAAERGMWIAEIGGYQALVDCADAANGLFAPTPTGTELTEDPDAYLDVDHAIDIPDGCGVGSASPAPATPS